MVIVIIMANGGLICVSGIYIAARDGKWSIQSTVMGSTVPARHCEGAVPQRPGEKQCHRRTLLQVSDIRFSFFWGGFGHAVHENLGSLSIQINEFYLHLNICISILY